MGSGASVVTKTDVEVLNDKRDELSGRYLASFLFCNYS